MILSVQFNRVVSREFQVLLIKRWRSVWDDISMPSAASQLQALAPSAFLSQSQLTKWRVIWCNLFYQTCTRYFINRFQNSFQESVKKPKPIQLFDLSKMNLKHTVYLKVLLNMHVISNLKVFKLLKCILLMLQKKWALLFEQFWILYH